MKNLETMNIKEAVEHCYDRRDYPEVICDDAGLDISIPGFITKGPWVRDVDCYDSEELFEFGQQYIDPMDNNGEPTREIYDDEWHLMWQNAQIVNYGQLITNSLQNIKKYLFHLMEAEPESFSGGNIPLGLVKEVMETLGWVVSDEIDTNGWDVDYWIYATKELSLIHISEPTRH